LAHLPQYDHRRAEVRIEGAGNHAAENMADKNKGSVVAVSKGEGSNRRSPNLEGFNESLYIRTARKDQDTYKLNAFNQAESDRLHSDRAIPDSRHYRWAWSCVYVCICV